MSAPPPAKTGIPEHRSNGLQRYHLMVAVACIALAGCATQDSYQLAGAPALDEHILIADRSQRDQYLNGVRSDPLGAYLAANDLVSRPSGTSRGLASTAVTFIGINYRYGGNSPDQGFDCSGLVRYAAEKSLGLKLPRRSADMARLGVSIKRDDLKRGDLVFFNTLGRRFSHVGIYLGDGKFVHAPSTGSKVRVESIDVAYWRERYNGARRLAGGPASQAGNNTKATKLAAN